MSATTARVWAPILSSLVFVTTVSCSHAPPPPLMVGPTVELILASGRANERPLTPPPTFEMLMRFNPEMPAYVPKRLLFLLAQPGLITFTIYGTSSEGLPGAALTTISRSYGPSFMSTGSDGKWVSELLTLPEQHGPIWIGICAPSGGDPRLWATSTDTGAVFQRDPDPATPFSSTKIPRTPLVRLELSPVEIQLTK